MKISLINPPMSHEELYGEWDMSDVKSTSPPIGLLSLAAVAREAGHEVQLVDALALGYNIEKIVEDIDGFGPGMLCISSMTHSIESAGNLARELKGRYKETPVILGGVHITALPEETMEAYAGVDIGVLGEGERTFIELIDRLESSGDLKAVAGLILRNGDGTYLKTAPREFIKDLDELPFPAWDMVAQSSKYRLSAYGTKEDNSFGLITSRGCPGQCTFCDQSAFGKNFRGHSAEYIVNQIEELRRTNGVSDFLFYDDLFVANRKRLEKVCALLKERNIKITWSCCSRVDYIKPETLKLMKQSGCWMVEFGIESGSQKLLDFMKKNITLAEAEQGVRLCKEAGILTKGNFIFGNLMETKETLEESINFAIKLDIDYFQHTFLSPLPGSKVYELASEYGEFDRDWKKMNTFVINFVPKGLTREDLIYYSKRAWRRFYLRPKIILHEFGKIKDFASVGRLMLGAKAFVKSAVLRS
jgi:radical SAM superfamily enzyme YgiQ (UPF0313 family)